MRCTFLLPVSGRLAQQAHHGTTHSLVMSSRVSDHVGWRHGSQQMVAPGACALHQQLPSALQVRHPRQSPPQVVLLSSNLAFAEARMKSACPTGVPNIFTPSGLQTSGPSTCMFCWALSGLVPHTRLLRVHSDASSSEQPVRQQVAQKSASFRSTQDVDIVEVLTPS